MMLDRSIRFLAICMQSKSHSILYKVRLRQLLVTLDSPRCPINTQLSFTKPSQRGIRKCDLYVTKTTKNIFVSALFDLA